MGDLLIAAAIDLGEGRWFAANRERLVAGFALGKAGDIAVDEPAGALLVRRAYGRPPYDQKPRTRLLAAANGPGYGHVLFAGRLMERARLAREHGLDPAFDDAALYGAVYAALGERCDDALIGNYAVIQWFPAERRIRLARSPAESQPLHFWRDGDRVVAASIPRMIHAAAGIPRVLDRRHAANALLLNLRDDTRSWFSGIERVPAGSVVTLDRAGQSTERYWSIDGVRPVRFPRDEDYVEAVEEQFRRAARASLEGIIKPGLTLSGGLDSQAVASFVLGEMPAGARMPAWTSVPHPDFKQGEGPPRLTDESNQVRALVAMHPRIEPHFVTGFDAPFGERLAATFLLGDCPTQNEGNLHWWHEIATQAVGAGCDVLLGGDAGNLTFSYDGLTGFPAWLREGRLLHLLREVRAMPDGRPLWRRLVSRAVVPNLPLAWRVAADRHRPQWYPSPFVTWNPMREGYAERSGAAERARLLGHDVTFHPFRSARDARAGMLAATANEGPEIGVALTLVHGIPDRDPTAFRPLLELTLGMPDDQFLRAGTTRWLARRLLKGRVPEEVRLERRRGVQAADWALRLRRDRPQLLADLADLARDPELAEVIDFARLTRSLADWTGGADGVASDMATAVTRGVTTARFMRFAEGRNRG